MSARTVNDMNKEELVAVVRSQQTALRKYKEWKAKVDAGGAGKQVNDLITKLRSVSEENEELRQQKEIAQQIQAALVAESSTAADEMRGLQSELKRLQALQAELEEHNNKMASAVAAGGAVERNRAPQPDADELQRVATARADAQKMVESLQVRVMELEAAALAQQDDEETECVERGDWPANPFLRLLCGRMRLSDPPVLFIA